MAHERSDAGAAVGPAIPTRTLVLGMVRPDGTLPADDLYRVAEACGMTDQQVRLCLRRLVAEGALTHQHGRGRRATFVAAHAAQDAILPELAFLHLAYQQDAGTEPWDGRWRLAGFNIPEARRPARDQLRDRLLRLGGALVHGGLYVSPHPWDELVTAEAQQLDVDDTLTLVDSDHLSVGGIDDPQRLAGRLWPLAQLARDYGDFTERLRARLEHARDAAAPAPDAVLRDTFLTAVEFARVMERDPLLPPELLPHPWPGREARAALCATQDVHAAHGVGDRLPGVFRTLSAPTPAA